MTIEECLAMMEQMEQYTAADWINLYASIAMFLVVVGVILWPLTRFLPGPKFITYDDVPTELMPRRVDETSRVPGARPTGVGFPRRGRPIGVPRNRPLREPTAAPSYIVTDSDGLGSGFFRVAKRRANKRR